MAKTKKLFIALLALVVIFVAQPASAVSHKVVFSDSAPDLALGGSVDLDITLDQPIICDPGLVCKIDVDFSNLPTGVTVTPTQVTWLSAEWGQPRTITVSVNENASDLVGQTLNIAGQLTTNASYYAPETPTFALTIPAAVPDVVAYNHRGLANTGSNDDSLAMFGGAFLISGIAVSALARRKVRK
jgi:LPXTG-motif cell wall-anchored protein